MRKWENGNNFSQHILIININTRFSPKKFFSPLTIWVRKWENEEGDKEVTKEIGEGDEREKREKRGEKGEIANYKWASEMPPTLCKRKKQRGR